jgi:phage baseplate assembly protein W
MESKLRALKNTIRELEATELGADMSMRREYNSLLQQFLTQKQQPLKAGGWPQWVQNQVCDPPPRSGSARSAAARV